MTEVWISIAVNVVLGIVLLALLYWKGRGDNVRLSGADEAMNIFLMHFPDGGRCRHGGRRPTRRADRSATPDPIYLQGVMLAQLLLLLLIPLEILLASGARVRAEYDVNDTLANVAVSIGSIFFWGTLSWIFFTAVTFVYSHRLFNIPFTWWSFLIAFTLEDLRYYVWHRISHRSRWFWASHVVHHSSQHFNLSTNLRQSWTSQFSGLILLNVPRAFIGFHAGIIALVFSLNLLYQFWIHTEAIDRMPRWFEWLLNTPSHHRVHHASNPRYLDANYAGVFMIWDRLFGTFVQEQREEPPRYGIVNNLGTFNPVRIALHEYVGIVRDLKRRNLTLGQRIGYFFGPPGWSHDGSRGTTESLRAAELERRRRSNLISPGASMPQDLGAISA